VLPLKGAEGKPPMGEITNNKFPFSVAIIITAKDESKLQITKEKNKHIRHYKECQNFMMC
jgi:hypothetical protein